MGDLPKLRLVSAQSTAPPTEQTIVIGVVQGVYRVSVLWKQSDAGEKLGGDFAIHADALKYAHQLRLSKGWTVCDTSHADVDF